MLSRIVTGEEVQQPRIGLGLVLGFVEVIQGFVHLLDRAKRSLDLALGPCGHATAIGAGR